MRSVPLIVELLVAIALLSVVGACAAQRPALPQRVFVQTLGSDPETFDPGMMSGSVEGEVAYQIFEGLLSPPPGDGDPVPGVASAWELSDDRRVYTFHLRPEARWSNGDPLTADDFRYAWMRVLRGDVPADYGTFMHYIEHARAWLDFREHIPGGWLGDAVDALAADCVGIEVRDAHTLVVTLQTPTAYFDELAMFYTFFPVHRASIEEFGQEDAFTAANIVTNGPFRIADYERRSRLRLVQNEHWWGRADLGLDEVHMLIAEDAGARVTAYMDGRADWADEPPSNQLRFLRTDDGFRQALMLGTYFYRFNLTRPPLNDVRVRRALSLALNRAELCDCTMDSLYRPATGFVPPMDGFEPMTDVHYDPNEARRLLAEAGYPGGEGFPTLQLLYNTSENHKTIAEAVQDMWQTELGVTIELNNQEWKVYLETVESLDYDIARAGWIGDYTDPNTFLEMWRSFDQNNNTGWDNPSYDRLTADAAREPDPSTRAGMLRQAEQMVLDEVPIAPLYWYSQFHLVRPNVRGWEMNSRGTHLARWISKDPAPTTR